MLKKVVCGSVPRSNGSSSGAAKNNKTIHVHCIFYSITIVSFNSLQSANDRGGGGGGGGGGADKVMLH